MDDTRPSLRQLAAAADVTVPTLRHYFGTREAVVEAVLVEYRRMGHPYIKLIREPEGDLGHSVLSFLNYMLSMLIDYPFLGDVFALGFVEGMFSHKLGPVCLTTLVDPMIEAVEARLMAHQARGEMIATNARFAAMSLTAPVLMACHHQNQMYGRKLRPIDFQDMIEGLASAFVRAYGVVEAGG
jgi:AcrR family transcriptional regulator